MPAYNCADYIVESIRSVQSQTYRNWELIIADDKSTDGTVDIVRVMAGDDNRIRLLETDRNLGPAAARNRAMDVANGTILRFLTVTMFGIRTSFKSSWILWRLTAIALFTLHMKK